MNLSEDHLRVLSALRRASVLRREPRTLAPDGQKAWHTLSSLGDSYWAPDTDLAPLDRALRGLYKLRLVRRLTLHTVIHWGITREGMLALYAHDSENGLADYSAALLELDQAEEDVRCLQGQLTAANAAAEQARKRVNRELAALAERPRTGVTS